jgi:hypothetical protein
VKGLIEEAVLLFVQSKEKQRLNEMSKEEKEDVGLLFLMQQVDKSDTVSESDFFDALNE